MMPENYSLVRLKRARPGAGRGRLILVHGCFHSRALRRKDYREWAESCREAGFSGEIDGYYWDSVNYYRLLERAAGALYEILQPGESGASRPARLRPGETGKERPEQKRPSAAGKLISGTRKGLGAAKVLAVRAGPALAGKILDGTRENWEEAKALAETAGAELAGKIGGCRRPVRLMGHSLGCRAVKACLENLEPGGLKGGSVYLLGAAVPVGESWERAAAAVEGKIFNYYSRSDPVLKYPYRTAELLKILSLLERRVPKNLLELLPRPGRRKIAAGRMGIEKDWGKIVNKDVSDSVSGHGDFERRLPRFLRFPAD
jgi:hypothetical protein